MSDTTINTAAQTAVQQQSTGTIARRSSAPRMDVLDIENIAGINLDMMRLAQRTRPALQVERAVVSQSYREETVIDFAQGTVSNYVNEDMSPRNSGPFEAFQRDDAAVQITFSASDYQSGQLEMVIREMAADHLERRNALQAYFAGQEDLEQILEEVDSLYQEGQEAVAASFANMVDCFWECRGQGSLEQREMVRSSVEALFIAYEAQAMQEEVPETGSELLTLQELDSTAASIAATIRSANLPSGRALGVMQYRAAAAMQSMETSRSLGQG